MSASVFRLTDAVSVVDAAWIARIEAAAQTSPTGRARVCLHADDAEPIHEMAIAFSQRSLVRPHRHPRKTESFCAVRGVIEVMIFDDDGRPMRLIRIAPMAEGGAPVYRIAPGVWHSIAPATPTATVLETTNGPFDAASTEEAGWAPADAAALRDFLGAARSRLAP